MLRALDGIRVLDFTHVWQGPIATQILGDFGADVIKIESPGRGDWSRGYGPFANGLSLTYANLNRNKRSLVLDLASEGGRRVKEMLVRQADVLVHNFRPGVVEKLGLDYETVHALNSKMIYASSSGWGDEGPYVERRRGGHAAMAAATAGLFAKHSDESLPTPPTISIDYPAGMILTQAILIGLLARVRHGIGQKLSTDLFSAALLNHSWRGGAALNPEYVDESKRDLRATEQAIPFVWRTADGLIQISPVFSDDALDTIASAAGADELLHDPLLRKPEDRLANRDLIRQALNRTGFSGGRFV